MSLNCSSLAIFLSIRFVIGFGILVPVEKKKKIILGVLDTYAKLMFSYVLILSFIG